MGKREKNNIWIQLDSYDTYIFGDTATFAHIKYILNMKERLQSRLDQKWSPLFGTFGKFIRFGFPIKVVVEMMVMLASTVFSMMSYVLSQTFLIVFFIPTLHDDDDEKKDGSEFVDPTLGKASSHVTVFLILVILILQPMGRQ